MLNPSMMNFVNWQIGEIEKLKQQLKIFKYAYKLSLKAPTNMVDDIIAEAEYHGFNVKDVYVAYEDGYKIVELEKSDY